MDIEGGPKGFFWGPAVKLKKSSCRERKSGGQKHVRLAKSRILMINFTSQRLDFAATYLSISIIKLNNWGPHEYYSESLSPMPSSHLLSSHANLSFAIFLQTWLVALHPPQPWNKCASWGFEMRIKDGHKWEYLHKHILKYRLWSLSSLFSLFPQIFRSISNSHSLHLFLFYFE